MKPLKARDFDLAPDLDLSRLQRSKTFREAVKIWGEPDGPRKRVIVAPPMAGMVAKDVDLVVSEINLGKKANLDPYSDTIQLIKKLTLRGNHYDVNREQQYLELLQKFNSYKKWLSKQKTERNDLNNLDLSADWLLKKTDRTALEDRVLGRMLPPRANTSEIQDDTMKGLQVERTPTPPPLSKAQLQLLPLLQQPIPVALSILTEYCVTKRLRLLDLFAQMDKDKDWMISRKEFTDVVESRQIPMTKGQIEDLIIALDADNNDQLNYQELARGMEAYKIDDRWRKIKELLEIQKQMESEGLEIFRHLTSTQKSYRKSTSARAKSSSPSRLSTSRDSCSEHSDSFLKLPGINMREEVVISDEQFRERRAEKHRHRKDKMKRKLKRVRSGVAPPTTIRGDVQHVKDRYANLMLKQTNDTLDRMHASGIPIKTETVKRVVLFPYDKSVEECKSNLRQPGLDTMSKSLFIKNEEDLLSNKSQERRSRRKRRKKDIFRSGNSISSIRRSVEIDPFWPQNDNRVLHLDDLKTGRPSDSIFQTVKTHYCL